MHRLYVEAGPPGLRAIAKGIRDDSSLGSTLNPSALGRILNGAVFPKGYALRTLSTWLAGEAQNHGTAAGEAEILRRTVEESWQQARPSPKKGTSGLGGAVPEHPGTASASPEKTRSDVPWSDARDERLVLGGMLLNKDVIADVVEHLRARDFSHSAHASIYETILDVYANGDPADAASISARLDKSVQVQADQSVQDYLDGLVAEARIANEIAELCAMRLVDRAFLRDLVLLGRRVDREHVSEVEADVDARATAMSTEMSLRRLLKQREEPDQGEFGWEGALDEIEAVNSRGIPTGGISTGFPRLDYVIGSLRPGQLVVVAGDHSMGKSTLALDFVRSCSIAQGLASVFFSCEMTDSEIRMRLLSAEGRVPLFRLRSGGLREEEWTRLARHFKLAAALLYIEDSPRLSMQDIRERSESLSARNDLRLAVVDCVQLVVAPDIDHDGPRSLARSLKQLARDLKIPVVVVSRLIAGTAARSERPPSLSDLEPSLLDEADVIILLHREDAHDKASPRAGEADLQVAKQRSGPTGVVTVAFQAHYSRFMPLEPTDPPTA
nr:DnaB-like helicase C-terminal domain-containing protein [Streptomyces sp. SID3343]